MSDNLPALADLANQINAEHEACHFAMRESIKHAVRAGELLVEAKAGLPHGEWASWLDAHCDFSDRTARAYMRLAKELPKLDEANRQRIAEMPLREALVSIADPKRKDSKEWAAEINAFSREAAEQIEEMVGLLEKQRRAFAEVGHEDAFHEWVMLECLDFPVDDIHLTEVFGTPPNADILIDLLKGVRSELIGEGRADRADG